MVEFSYISPSHIYLKFVRDNWVYLYRFSTVKCENLCLLQQHIGLKTYSWKLHQVVCPYQRWCQKTFNWNGVKRTNIAQTKPPKARTLSTLVSAILILDHKILSLNYVFEPLQDLSQPLLPNSFWGKKDDIKGHWNLWLFSVSSWRDSNNCFLACLKLEMSLLTNHFFFFTWVSGETLCCILLFFLIGNRMVVIW